MKLSWDSLNCKHIANELVQHSNTHYLHMQWAKFCIRKLYIKRLIQTTFPNLLCFSQYLIYKGRKMGSITNKE